MQDDETLPSYAITGNNFSYLGRPLTRRLDDVDVAVLGVPYDMGTSGRAGTRHGPQAVRAASANLRWEERRWPWRFNAFERIRVVDHGDVVFPPGESEKMVAALEETADRILAAGCRLLTFGGDHFITLPLLRAHARRYGAPVRMIHFDAHTDNEATDDTRYYHGSMFYRAPKEGVLDAAHSVQVGIRTEYDYENHPFTVIDAERVADLGVDGTVEAIRAAVGDAPVYVTFDIDCLDPAYAPGTGTPVAGGLASATALSILRRLEGLDLVGMDITEVSPPYDHGEITALAAATLGLEYLYLVAAARA